MNRFLWFLLIAMLCFASAVAAEDTIVIFRWTDAQGKIHFTTNYNTIPKPFRKTSVKGVFLPDTDPKTKAPKPRCKNSDPEPRDTNYYVKGGNIYVAGTIANGYVKSISYVKVKISFFDAGDQFVKAESTFIEPLELAPCRKGHFTIVTSHQDNIATFKPEFSWK